MVLRLAHLNITPSMINDLADNLRLATLVTKGRLVTVEAPFFDRNVEYLEGANILVSCMHHQNLPSFE